MISEIPIHVKIIGVGVVGAAAFLQASEGFETKLLAGFLLAVFSAVLTYFVGRAAARSGVQQELGAYKNKVDELLRRMDTHERHMWEMNREIGELGGRGTDGR